MKYLKDVATLKFSPDKCTGCFLCVYVCPHGVFTEDGKKAAITDRDLCMECGACMKNCAFDAIDVSTGVGCASALINAILTGGEPSCDCSDNSNSCC